MEGYGGLGQPTTKRWCEFRVRIPSSNWCESCSAATITQVLGSLATVTTVPYTEHNFLPKPSVRDPNPKTIAGGYTYVDMDYSLCSNNKVALSHASNCVIIVILDLRTQKGQGHFVCHMAASLERWKGKVCKLKPWVANLDPNQTVMLLFTEKVYRQKDTYTYTDTTYELENVMALLLQCDMLTKCPNLHNTTYVIGGQGATNWNAYCAVGVNEPGTNPRLKIVFAKDK
jgi:hypothetical protein